MKKEKLLEKLVVKDKAYYVHGLFDLMAATNLRQIKVICAFASFLLREQIGVYNGEEELENEI